MKIWPFYRKFSKKLSFLPERSNFPDAKVFLKFSEESKKAREFRFLKNCNLKKHQFDLKSVFYFVASQNSTKNAFL